MAKLSAVFVVCVLLPLLVHSKESWTAWKTLNNKKYDIGEEARRRIIWETNLRLIDTHNQEYQEGKHTYTLGLNEWADMTNAEFKRGMCGYGGGMGPQCQAAGNITWPRRIYGKNISELPSYVDWRRRGYVTPVKNQKMCGSCWAFSATGALEGQNFKATRKLVSLSEQNILDCSKNQGNDACNGGWMNAAFNYVADNGGIDTEACYPYTMRQDEGCLYNSSCSGCRVASGCADVLPHRREDLLRAAVAIVGPVSVAIDAGTLKFQFYRRGVFHDRFCSQTDLDHGVLVVGYGSENSAVLAAGLRAAGSREPSKREPLDYWIVKNSWGTTWGMSGYVLMSRNKSNQCGIATQASYPTVRHD